MFADAEGGFEIRPVEAFRAQSAAGGSYQSPSEDGSRPGIFYVNTYDLPSRKTWDMESLFLHEAIPGHHFQIALAAGTDRLPNFRRFGGETAYIEGWGLYAESLGKELGVYTDPYSISAAAGRAVALDPARGRHRPPQQELDPRAGDRVHARPTPRPATPKRSPKPNVTSRFPGQALAYKIGELKIKRTARPRRKALGEPFRREVPSTTRC
jgi:uncharacterized protein (DUF885 family)